MLAILVSAAIGFRSYNAGSQIVALIPLAIGIAALIAIAPFAAYTRTSRTRVMRACILYTIGSGISFVLAVALDPTVPNLMTLVLPVLGAALSVWAYRTRGRHRVVGFANYYRG
ncbi:hypothetical protein U1737_03745 [Sphingomonas sp. LB3N6]|nr:hypothetical protein [Sphingomonas faeni]MCK8456194.1 hypothetical protein [Sphingomonas faeni]